MYKFYLNMWIMKKIDTKYLQDKVTAGKIAQDEYNKIIIVPQMTTNN